MGYNNIQHGYRNTGAYCAPGAARIIFIPSEDVRGYEVMSGDTVNRVILAPQGVFHLFDDLDNVSYVPTTTPSKSGKLYQLDLSFTVPILTGQKSTLFDQMMDTDLVAIVQDNHFSWWLLGHEQPLRLLSNEGKVDNDNNGYTLKLSTKQREAPYHMSSAWIQSLNNLPFSETITSEDAALTPVTISVPTPTSGQTNPLPSNVGNVKVAPNDGYVIETFIDYVLALGGRTVRLPQNPQDGRAITIKDLNGTANILPVTIDGNGRAIDQDLTFSINTATGAISLFYAANKWNAFTFTL